MPSRLGPKFYMVSALQLVTKEIKSKFLLSSQLWIILQQILNSQENVKQKALTHPLWCPQKWVCNAEQPYKNKLRAERAEKTVL